MKKPDLNRYRFASIFFPEFPIQLYCLSSGAPYTASIALYKRTSKGTEILYCSQSARRSGIRPGMPITIATALDSSLITVSTSLIDPLHALSSIGQSLLSFSPIVGIDHLVRESCIQDKAISPLYFGININFSRTTRLYPSDSALLSRLQQRIIDLQITAKIALAATLGRAWAHARFSAAPSDCNDDPSSVNSYHVSALRIPEETITVLEEFGLTTIGSISKIPHKSLKKRFGSLLVERLNSLEQQREEAIEPVIPLPIRITSFVFDPPTEDIHAVRHAIVDRYNYLASAVHKEHKSIRGLKLEVRTTTESFFKSLTTYSHQTAEQLCDLLESFLKSNSYQSGVTHVCIKVTDIEDTSYFQDDLFSIQKTHSDDIESKFISLISNKFNTAQIHIARMENAHLPELEMSFTSIQRNKPFVLGSSVASNSSSIRPGIFYSKSKRITVTLSEDTGRPKRIQYRKANLSITRSIGPENIEYPWYLGGVPHQRSYYNIQDTLGRWYWIYNNSKDNSWYLSGIFA